MTDSKGYGRAASGPRDGRAESGDRDWGGGQSAGANATVEQFLMRGLDTACQAYVVVLPRTDPRRSALLLPILAEDSPTGTSALAAASGRNEWSSACNALLPIRVRSATSLMCHSRRFGAAAIPAPPGAF